LFGKVAGGWRSKGRRLKAPQLCTVSPKGSRTRHLASCARLRAGAPAHNKHAGSPHTCVQPAVGVDCVPRVGLVLEVPLEHDGAAHADLQGMKGSMGGLRTRLIRRLWQNDGAMHADLQEGRTSEGNRGTNTGSCEAQTARYVQCRAMPK